LNFSRRFKGPKGRNGGRDYMTGRNGKDILVNVPCGTVVRCDDSGIVLADLMAPGMKYVAAVGARGGLGNGSKHSSLHRNSTAMFGHAPGGMGEEKFVSLELRMIADVALVGAPNAGKSSLLAALSKTTPKIASYPFTTLRPHVGACFFSSRESEATIRIADIPGLIEGASEGKGLGTDFLRHVERCKTLVFMLDAGPGYSGVSTAAADLQMLIKEVASWKEGMMVDRPRFVFANKLDEYETEAEKAAVMKTLENCGMDVIGGSVHEGDGLARVALKMRQITQSYDLTYSALTAPAEPWTRPKALAPAIEEEDENDDEEEDDEEVYEDEDDDDDDDDEEDDVDDDDDEDRPASKPRKYRPISDLEDAPVAPENEKYEVFEDADDSRAEDFWKMQQRRNL